MEVACEELHQPRAADAEQIDEADPAPGQMRRKESAAIGHDHGERGA